MIWIFPWSYHYCAYLVDAISMQSQKAAYWTTPAHRTVKIVTIEVSHAAYAHLIYDINGIHLDLWLVPRWLSWRKEKNFTRGDLYAGSRSNQGTVS